jgi:phage-related protein
MRPPVKRVPAVFFRTLSGNEPVREWLKTMAAADRRAIGGDIQKVEFGWPTGMPLTRQLGDGLHEIRSNLQGNRIARVFFYVSASQKLILLHGIIKKSQQTPRHDLDLARRNMRLHEGEEP